MSVYPTQLAVSSFLPSSIQLEWSLSTTTEDLRLWRVQVLRSEAEWDGYQAVSPVLVAADVTSFSDGGVNLMSMLRDYYYRLRIWRESDPAAAVTYGPGGAVGTAAAVAVSGWTLGVQPDVYALEIARRFDLVLREHIGRAVLVFPVKTSGQRCSDCYDALKARRTKSNCLSCYDTGWAGGYYRPIEAWAAKPNGARGVQLTTFGALEPNDRPFWLSMSPRVKPNDLLVTSSGDRYRILRIEDTEKGWAATRQTFVARQLTRDQAEYRIPVSAADWQRSSANSTPQRERRRVTDIDSYYALLGEAGGSAYDPSESVAPKKDLE